MAKRPGKNLYGARLRGLDKVAKKLNKRIAEKQKGFERGLVRGGLFIQAESQKLAPVDTGNLRNSAFTVWTGGKRPQSKAIKTLRKGTRTRDNKGRFEAGSGEHISESTQQKLKDGDGYIDDQRMRTNGSGLRSTAKLLKRGGIKAAGRQARSLFRVRIGYTAFYALFVHEGAKGRGPVPFLKLTLARTDEIMRQIKAGMRGEGKA